MSAVAAGVCWTWRLEHAVTTGTHRVRGARTPVEAENVFFRADWALRTVPDPCIRDSSISVKISKSHSQSCLCVPCRRTRLHGLRTRQSRICWTSPTPVTRSSTCPFTATSATFLRGCWELQRGHRDSRDVPLLDTWGFWYGWCSHNRVGSRKQGVVKGVAGRP